ncbi:hypothetical protein VTK56DRAFT_10036 [Thermocarpiscus australiensis]
MVLDQKLGTVVSQFAQFNLDADPRPDSTGKTVYGIPGLSAPVTSVTVTELLDPPASPNPTGEAVSSEPTADPQNMPQEEAPGTFLYFPLLPAELRLKIWHMSFLPRTVELHTRRTHYADDDSGTPKWQSLSRNPAALSVNAEARAAALEHYAVALPLAAPVARRELTTVGPSEILQPGDRLLYLNLEEDTVVLLGEMHYARLTKLLDWFRKTDVSASRRRRHAPGGCTIRGKGARKLAMSAGCWIHEVGAATLKAFARTVFADIEEFVLFTYMERVPPESWTGGSCVLEEASPDADHVRHFVIGRGKQFWTGNGWMVVGRRSLKVADIRFDDGW